ncbi:hypothetical protein AAFF_G00325980 [Aldrovandia affinis]|uniref:Uncharacterized protein n=1 Tax=Aldrovandia affinis TaxID=143900 RepID=A0AAD7T967_9TELE|nr:hypothetical protein AAFF_G00325980 [Aldrovandia affinis]
MGDSHPCLAEAALLTGMKGETAADVKHIKQSEEAGRPQPEHHTCCPLGPSERLLKLPPLRESQSRAPSPPPPFTAEWAPASAPAQRKQDPALAGPGLLSADG